MSRPLLSSLRTTVRRTALRPAPAPRILQIRALPTASIATLSVPSIRVPSEGAFLEVGRHLQLQRGDPKLYRRCAVEFQAAIKRGRADASLLKKIGASLQDFHEAAIFAQAVTQKEPSGNPRTCHAFVLAMLRYASDMGHEPSTLTYVSFTYLLHDTRDLSAPVPDAVLERMMAIAARRDSADAVFLMARMTWRSGHGIESAERLYRAALELGDREGAPAFAWRGDCLVDMGRLCREKGDAARAREYFHRAVKEHDLLRASLELLYDWGVPEDVVWATPHALRGNKAACLRLSEAETEAAVKALEAGDKTGFTDHQVMAQEWLKLANIQSVADANASNV